MLPSIKKSISLSEIDNDSLTPSGLVLSNAHSSAMQRRAPSEDFSVEGDGSSVSGGSQQLASVPENKTTKNKVRLLNHDYFTTNHPSSYLQAALGLAGATLAFEALRKFRQYLGLDPSGAAHVSEMDLDWQLKVAKPSINVSTTMVAGESKKGHHLNVENDE